MDETDTESADEHAQIRQSVRALCAKFPGESVVVASSGTATTIECVRGEPNAAALFLGGVIAPGVDLMHESLARGTARLPDARYVIDGKVVAHPDNTDDAIVTGVFHAQAGMIYEFDEAAGEFRREQDVGELGAAIGPPALGAVSSGEIGEIQRSAAMRL